MAQAKRVALIIGNSNYDDGKLVSGVKNAEEIYACLGDLGFADRELVRDGTLEAMKQALARFQAKVGSASVALFYYSGHGFQVLDKNYLLPREGDISASRSLPVNDVLQSMDSGPGVVKLVILDACRDRRAPSTTAFAEPEAAPSGVYQAFSASPGQLAQSGSADELSLYTMALLRHIREPGLELMELFDRVREDLDLAAAEQFPVEAGDAPQKFHFQPPVEVQLKTFGWPYSRTLAFLDGRLVLPTSAQALSDQPSVRTVPLKARENDLVLMVSHGKTYHNDQIWGRTQGWNYKLDLKVPDKNVPEGRTVTFTDKEPVPFKDGPQHGQTFIVGKATLYVHPQTAEVETRDLETDTAHRTLPFWADDQEILFQEKLVNLPLSAAELLGGSLNFGLTPLLIPFLDEFLKTGKVLDAVVVDPDKSYVAVRGNKALREVVQHCMIAEWPYRVRDLRASFTAFFNRHPRPFDVFADGLNESVRARAASVGFPVKPEDLKVWTSLDDLSPEALANEAQPAARLAATLSAASAASANEASPEAALLALAQESILQPQPGEALIDNRIVEQTVEGVPLRAQVYTFLTVKPVDAQVQLHVRVIADLSDLQNKIGPLVDTIRLPTDNCSHFGLDNIVARIWGKQITIDGNTATLKLNGDVEIWTCLKNPIQCSKVEWDGIIPKVVWWDCNPPIKNRNASQPFEATLPFQVEVVPPQSYALKLGDPSVDLRGPLGGVTEGILKIAGVDINAKVKEALNRAIHPDALQQTLPDFVLKYNPTLTRAELLSNSGTLALRLETDATLNVWQLAELVRELISRQ